MVDEGAARQFRTDLTAVTVPYPPGDTRLRALTCALALQCSPTKETAARIPWTGFRRRKRQALALVEGEMAVRWACLRWPGLANDLRARFPWVEDGPVVTGAVELTALADERSRSPRLREPPELFGLLPAPTGTSGGSLRRTFIATRWSNRHKSRRTNADMLPIPVSGPATEPILHPGEPGSIEALAGRSGHQLGIPYPEWDRWRQRYREDYVRVIEIDDPPKPGPVGPPLRVARPKPNREVRRGFEHGMVDIDSVVAWRCDLAAGHQPANVRLFSQLTPNPAPVAWALLVDSSASASLSGGQVLARSLAHADALTAGLSANGEKVAVFSFRSHARERVEVRVLKRFDRPYKPLAADVKPRGYTRLGAAIRHAGARLTAVPAHAHVLLYLGDAVPYDEGYGDRYGRGDVAKAVGELRDRGTLVFHASVATAEPAGLDEMFGSSGWRPTPGRRGLLGLVAKICTALEREQ